MKIYYFSGSGNSLHIARELNKRFDGELVPIASVITKNTITVDDDCFGIVFPVYFTSNDSGIPLVVQRFIDKLNNINNKYIFTVCTLNYSLGCTIENTLRMIKAKGGTLSSSFVINTSNTNVKEDIVLKLTKKKGKTKSNNYKKSKIQSQIDHITKIVANRQTVKFKTRSSFVKILMFPLTSIAKVAFKTRYQRLSGKKFKEFIDLVSYADNSFKSNSNCTGCGTCMSVCPMSNITILDNKPKWNNRCENCLACYHYCPQDAICGDIVEYNEKYHHPKVSINDMIEQKQKSSMF